MGMFENIGHDIGQAVESTVSLPVKVAEAGVRKLEGQPFVSTVKHHAVDALWNTLALPGRVFKHTILGLTKGTARLAWSAIKLLPLPLPMLESWKKERGDVAMRTKDALDLFRFSVDGKFVLPSLGGSTTQTSNAPARPADSVTTKKLNTAPSAIATK